MLRPVPLAFVILGSTLPLAAQDLEASVTFADAPVSQVPA